MATATKSTKPAAAADVKGDLDRDYSRLVADRARSGRPLAAGELDRFVVLGKTFDSHEADVQAARDRNECVERLRAIAAGADAAWDRDVAAAAAFQAAQDEYLGLGEKQRLEAEVSAAKYGDALRARTAAANEYRACQAAVDELKRLDV